MGVLSKLLHSLVPKTLTGIILLVLPLAAAVVVIVYPHAVSQLVMREDPNRLLEELTADEAGKNKKKAQKKVKREAVKKDVAKEESEESSTESLNEDEKLSQLVRMQEKKAQATKKPLKSEKNPIASKIQAPSFAAVVANVQSSATASSVEPPTFAAVVSSGQSPVTASDVQSPTTAAIEVASDGKEDEGWTRVPTKEEEIAVTLRTRVANLTRQLEASTSESAELKSLVQREEKRAMEAERELKDRSRSFQIRWVEMESEISSLKNSKAGLMSKVDELLSVSSEFTAHSETIKAQEAKITSLETALNASSTQESKTRSELGQVKAHLAAEKDSLAELKHNCIAINEQANNLMAQLEQSKLSQTELKENIRYLENELVTSQNNTKTDTIIADLQQKLDASIEETQKVLSEKDVLAAKLESSNSEQAAQIGELKGQIQVLEDRTEELQAISAKLEIAEKKVTEVEGENHRLQAVITTMKAQASSSLELQEKIAALEESLAKSQITESSKVKEVEAENQRLESTISSMTLLSKECEDKIAVLEASLAESQATESSKVKEVEAENQRLESTISSMTSLSKELEDKVAVLEESLAKSQTADSSKLKEVEAENQRLESAISSMTLLSKDFEDKIAVLEASLTESQAIENAKVKEFEAENQRLESAFSSMTSLSKELEEKIATFDEKFASLESSLQASQTERIKLAAELEEAQLRAVESAKLLEKADKKYDLLNKVAEAKYEAFKQEITALTSTA
ncbi:hypothetical protein PSACC_02447 [Paramicrosporidium saccamoebae]|uniref:Uncharacterized protein n=1 Tax=Paramicrosporidium saccamoebae TaxID=1246581 RepID=A0A2H9TJ15_9FUNG|nr:hypothetical protein PSACC_02447 [Paramicrosporidium saccamoebae]